MPQARTSMLSTPDNSPTPLAHGQFSLLGLLSFMLAWSVYFSALAAAVAMTRQRNPLPMWSGMLTFCVAWGVLALLYWSWRLRDVLLLHCFLPAVTILALWMPSLGVGWEVLHGNVAHVWPAANSIRWPCRRPVS